MNIVNSAVVGAAVNSASNGDLGTVQGAASTLMLRKALDVQAAGAAALLEALPQQPALATEGSVGRNVNTFA
ncbi:putative motility protein [Roseateles sp. BYS78W]|uniref:Motility protein n=1 Tax=Pelomonas candidula TaxID=3299025 RepID=A0ABW7HB39_9BURK